MMLEKNKLSVNKYVIDNLVNKHDFKTHSKRIPKPISNQNLSRWLQLQY